MKAEQIHFSIDDVIRTLRWLRDNKPNSIFDMDFFGTLKSWHERYGLKFSLYVFEVCEGFSIENVPQKYWEEFKENDSWLSLCWHRRQSGPLLDNYEAEIQSFNRVKNVIINRVSIGAWTDTVRLHRFEAGKDLIDYLREKGNIKCLLCADYDRLSYDLTDTDLDILDNKKIVIRNGLAYRKTDIRLDLLETDTDETIQSLVTKTEELLENDAGRQLVVFCHEWIFKRINKRIEQYLQYIID